MLEQFMQIMEELEVYEDDMDGKDYDFYADMKKKIRLYGERTVVSDHQMKWLKDIRRKFEDG